MPIAHCWDTEELAVRLMFVGKFEWADLWETMRFVNDLLDRGSTPVALILDLESVTWGALPSHMLDNISRLVQYRHPRIDSVVIITPEDYRRLVQLIITTLTGFVPYLAHVRVVTDLERARVPQPMPPAEEPEYAAV